jgi:tetratricopeptide (TPR) repeat protein
LALQSEDLAEDETLAVALRRIEAIASAGMTDQACELDSVLEEAPRSPDAVIAAAVEKLDRWAVCLWASEDRLVYMRRAAASSDGRSAQLALALGASARNLARSGRLDAAALRCEEAVSMWRDHGATQSSDADARLAESLRLLGAIETKRGNKGSAARAAAEACRMLRVLDQNEPSRHRATLASAMHNLAGARLDAGDVGGAVFAAHHAISLRRALALEAPSVCRADLAHTLSEASLVLSAAELTQEAIVASEEAIELFRAALLEEGGVKVHALASALRNFSQHALGAGRWQAGLDAVDEEIAIYRRHEREDGDAATHALANALHNRATFLAMLEQDEEALASVSEAIDTLRTLAGQTSRQAEIAASLRLAGMIAQKSGKYELALDRLAEAAHIRDTLRDGSRLSADEDYINTCIELSHAQSAAGRLADAAMSSGHAAAAMAVVARQRSDNADWLKYERLLLQTGNLQRRVGMMDAAIKSYETAALLRKNVCKAGLGGEVADTAAQRLIVCLKRAGRAEEAQAWIDRLGAANLN